MAGMRAGGSLLIGALLGIVMVAVVFGGEAAVSTTAFCTSCHSMSYRHTIGVSDAHLESIDLADFDHRL